MLGWQKKFWQKQGKIADKQEENSFQVTDT